MAYALLAVIGAVFAFGMGATISLITDDRLSGRVRWFAVSALVVLAVVSFHLATEIVSALP